MSVRRPLGRRVRRTSRTLPFLLIASIAGCGDSQTTPRVHEAPSIGTRAGSSFAPYDRESSPVVGQTLTVTAGTWAGKPTSYGYRWQACDASGRRCTDISGANSNSYTLVAGDVGRHLSAVVTAGNSAGSTSAASALTAAATGVGAPGPPVTCTTTLGVGADLQHALSSAKPGNVVCLNAGRYGDVTLAGISHSGDVTLAPAPHASVHLGSLTFVGPDTSSNLTVQGLHIDGGVSVRIGSPGGLVFEYNTIENIPRGYAYYFYARGSSSGNYTQTGVRMLYNQIDHVGACLEVDGGQDIASDFTFSHNVCGPGIGAGATSDAGASHYIQIGGITGVLADNNAFLGPMDPNYAKAGLHNNVFHVFGSSRDVEFSNNLMWHTQSRGQTILLEEGRLDNITINDNLDVEDPTCNALGDCSAYAIYVYDARGLTVQSNTIIDSYYGLLLTNAVPGARSAGSDYRVSGNVAVGTGGRSEIAYGRCVSGCDFDRNVTDDLSARQGGSTSFVAQWKPAWATTTWGPGPPYSPPPPGYYRPVGLPWPAGYQGTIGP